MVELPKFDRRDPIAWFLRIDSIFPFTNIHSDKEKYQILMANVGNAFLKHVDIDDVCHDNYYESLKGKIIDKFYELGEDEFFHFCVDTMEPLKASEIHEESHTSSAYTTLKLPPFYKEEPEAWFAEIEIIFSYANITSENEKCIQLLLNLEPKILCMIKDSLPIENMFDAKTKFVKRFGWIPSSATTTVTANGDDWGPHSAITTVTANGDDWGPAPGMNNSNENIEKRLKALEDKINNITANINVLPMELLNDGVPKVGIVEKNAVASYRTIDQRITALEEKTNEFAPLLFLESNRSNQSANILNESVKKLITVLEEMFINPNSTMNNAMEQLEFQNKNLVALHASVDRHLLSIEQKLDRIILF